MKKITRINIDTGGTFTDCIAELPSGEIKRRKVLSTGCLRAEIIQWMSPSSFILRNSWEVKDDFVRGYELRVPNNPEFNCYIISFDASTGLVQADRDLPDVDTGEILTCELTAGEEAPVLGIRMITGTGLGAAFPEMDVRLGTTKGTNALLEHRGSETILFTSSGFKDLLHIGNQQRPEIFARRIEKDSPLVSEIYEIKGRIDHDGNIISQIDMNALDDVIQRIVNKDSKSVAVSLLNAYKNPTHEQLIAQCLHNAGFKYVSVSSELSSMIKFLDRTETTVVNAYLSPIIRSYLGEISNKLGSKRLRVMTSAGGLVQASLFQPMDSLLSGPAGGVVGAALIGKQAGEDKLISFDMGGTSTDVSRFDGDFDYSYELQVGSAHIMSPALTIETVAAGGGSICGYDGYRLFVGPESAGADPGPACYGAGGPLTITDVNLLAGKLSADNFSIPIYPEAAERELEKLQVYIENEKGEKPGREELLGSFLAIANEIMAGAIKKISVLKGYSPSDYSLVTFGGAGGLHACKIAELLDIGKILVPEEAGLLSAYGIGNARVERFVEQQVLETLEDFQDRLEEHITELEKKAIYAMKKEGFSSSEIEIRNRMLFLRYRGQDSTLEINYHTTENIKEVFKKAYFRIYGHEVENRTIEIEAIRVVASNRNQIKTEVSSPEDEGLANPLHYTKAGIPVFLSSQLKPGQKVKGPALLLDEYSTTFIEKGWIYGMDSQRTGIIEKHSINYNTENKDKPFEAELELFTNRFMSIAEHMGAMLQRTAFSVNIKERLDFSCALLDQEGRLVANAPHIPVHLGGLSVCVQELLKTHTFQPGDTLVTNHPGYGGSHLPDVTTVTPVFDKVGELLAFVVNRAHHSEIGGISPGSMPPSAKNLAEEGVVIAPFLLVEGGEAHWEEMKELLSNAPFPSRNPEENLADLNAALAANMKGEDALKSLERNFGAGKIRTYFKALREYASARMSDTLKGIADGNYSATEFLDDGNPLVVHIKKEGGNCNLDFTGTAPVHPSNMNATIAIVNSVVIYVLRLLLDEPIPLNDGLLDPVDIHVPTSLLNPDFPENPFDCPAVVGGNVEISMRLTDTLLKAFGTMAASQGTMNNVLFGNEKFGYYETLAGGSGAGKGFHGANAVHHHMTNTRITDPEVIEHRYPVRILENSIVAGTGGSGKWQGGNGMKRVYEFREAVNLSILSQRRNTGPYGLQGGREGQKGHQYILHKDGTRTDLGHVDNLDLEAGDCLYIQTPGGGGYGIAGKE